MEEESIQEDLSFASKEDSEIEEDNSISDSSDYELPNEL
jgi:hypothetical protein